LSIRNGGKIEQEGFSVNDVGAVDARRDAIAIAPALPILLPLKSISSTLHRSLHMNSNKRRFVSTANKERT
jgi:hypothetical protein